MTATASNLIEWSNGQRFKTVLADPPWRFQNSTGKVAPEHKRLNRYETMSTDDIAALPVVSIVTDAAHLYLWVPNALLPDGLRVMASWGFQYKANIVWHKLRKDGGSDGRGVGFYFRNVTELVLFGVRGKNIRTREAGRRQVNYIGTQKREHSRKPDELYPIIEACSEGPFAELFARGERQNWRCWGNQAEDYLPTWETYAHHSQRDTAAYAVYRAQVATHPSKRLVPASFVEKALHPARGGELPAGLVYDAYAAECRALKVEPVKAIGFWQTLSARAKKLGAHKATQGGRIVYYGLRLAA